MISPNGPPVVKEAEATLLAEPTTVVGDENNESEFEFRLYPTGVYMLK